MADQFGYQGTENPSSNQGEFNALTFLMTQLLARLNISTLVKVVAVDDPGGVAMCGTVDVLPLVNQLDGSMKTVAHATIYGLPYFRLQGGSNAIIITPQVGDIGMAAFADRDISSVKATQAQANPGSLRRFDMADGMYFGGMLNAAPVRYVKIDDDGVTIEGVANVTIHGDNTTINATATTINTETAEVNASDSITVNSPTTTFNGDVEIDGNMHSTGTVTGDADVIANGTSGHGHTHGGVMPGGANTAPPN